MVQTLEAIKGGGGSVEVGTTGKIGALMTRELETVKCPPEVTVSSRNKAPLDPLSAPCGAKTCGIPKSRKPLDEASSSSTRSSTNHRILDNSQKAKSFRKKVHRIPMLGSDNISLDGTPTRQKNDKASYFAEVVDIKCGSTERTWANPIKSRLKKLNFSKLSESIV